MCLITLCPFLFGHYIKMDQTFRSSFCKLLHEMCQDLRQTVRMRTVNWYRCLISKDKNQEINHRHDH